MEMGNAKLREALGNVSKVDDFEHLLRVPFKDRLALPRVPALYFIHLPKMIVYVGATSDLKDRMREHHHLETFRDIERTTNSLAVAWFPAKNMRAAMFYEAMFINLTCAPLNRRRNGGGRKQWRSLSRIEVKQVLLEAAA